MHQDIRWKQRFSNFMKALKKLQEAASYIRDHYSKEQVDNGDERLVDEMIKESLIQRFEYTHELAWNVMKDYARYQGNSEVSGSRDATKEAFQLKLITDGHVWMDMIASRNKTSHTYNEDTANEIFAKIMSEYFKAFIDFEATMIEKLGSQQQDLFS